MATLNEIVQAMKTAHARGDIEAARKLARVVDQATGGRYSEGAGQQAAPPAAGPWTKYAAPAQPSPAVAGPWTKYAKPEPIGATGFGRPPPAPAGETTPPSARDEAPAPLPVASPAAAPEYKGPGIAGGAAAAATDGALFGAGDEYLAGLSAVLGVQPDGQGGATWFDYSKPMDQRYGIALDQIRREQGQFADLHPNMALGAEIAGAVAAPGGMAAKFVNRGATGAARVARGIGAGGMTGAAQGFGEGEDGVGNRIRSGVIGAGIGAATGGTMTGLGQGFAKAAQALSRSGQGATASAVDELGGVAKQLYKRAEAAGGVIPEARFQSMARGIAYRLQKQGYDADLHPRVAAVLRRLGEETGPKTLGQMEIIRRVAKNAAASAQPDERRIGALILDNIDATVDRMKGSEDLFAARKVWGQMRRLEAIEDAIERAAQSDNYTTALRTQFRGLMKNPKTLRGFTANERAAIARVATGTGTDRALRALGALLSPGGISGAALTGSAALGGAGMGAAAIPATGIAAKALAGASTRRAADVARATVLGRPLPAPAPNALARLVPGMNALAFEGMTGR